MILIEGVKKRDERTSSSYARLESGKTQPRVATCKRLAEAMGIKWEQLTE